MRSHTPKLLLLTLAILTGCTVIQVQPLPKNHALKRVCIENNPKVIRADFLPTVQEGFRRYGIATQVHTAPLPPDCPAILTYTARQSWDFAPYVADAELHLADSQGRPLASGTYHLRGGGGLSLMKWQSTASKIDPVIDQMLKGLDAVP
jgi:hypothetical protein